MSISKLRFGPISHAHHVLSFAERPRTQQQNFPQPRPAQEEHSAPRTHSQLRLARSHARHARNENEDETKPISRFRVAPRLPLNLRSYADDTIIISQGAREANILLHAIEEESKKYANVLGYNYNSSKWYENSYKVFNKKYEMKLNNKKEKKKNSMLGKIKSLFE